MKKGQLTVLHKKTNASGFTLIEVLLVIAILAILAAVVIVAINPAKQFQSAREAQRQTDVLLILNALHQYALDNEGEYPTAITTEQLEICNTGSSSCDGKYDLSALTDGQVYIVSLPVDPYCAQHDANCDDSETGYFLAKTDTGRIWVSAKNSENAEGEINVIR